MHDLALWLTAQLAEDERIVREANTSPEMVTGIPGSYAEAPVALHIAEFADPARVLREIEMKRSLVTAYTDMLTVGPDVEGGYTRPIREALARQARNFLLVMALPYAHRPGFAEAVASAD